MSKPNTCICRDINNIQRICSLLKKANSRIELFLNNSLVYFIILETFRIVSFHLQKR